MKRKKPSRKDLLSACDEIRSDDGVDPRYFFRERSEKKPNRKTLQLCGEVARTLGYALAWEVGDDLLRQLQVESVIPAPDSSRLLVTVSLCAALTTLLPEQLLERLQRVTGKLRAEIAAAIHRRRVPELTFRVGLRKEVADDAV
jgi:ribosome-binding factor A